ncbi:hypothetical protein QIU18_02020 [Capnocytophaga canimorsus]|nr:hypothetical protein [Capnocytophaga canimorsus]WGU70868.1 hypothetical protein QIU18_02020 [Capnocytophaga canimorsus]
MIWLDSNQYPDKYRQFEAVLAFFPHKILEKYESKGAFESFKSFIDATNDYIFGYLSYDLKNDVENLQSENFDGLKFPELYFFSASKNSFFFREITLFLVI